MRGFKNFKGSDASGPSMHSYSMAKWCNTDRPLSLILSTIIDLALDNILHRKNQQKYGEFKRQVG